MAMKITLLALVVSSVMVAAIAVDRLTITNGCSTQPIWVAHLANVGVGPGAQNVKIEPMGSHIFTDAETDGLGGARYWAKMGCDETGDNCKLGGSGGPMQKCSQATPDYSSCAPPIDTKFEATFGRQGLPCNPAVPSEMGGCDSVDVSLVDGWTLPFKFEVKSGTCTAMEKTISVIDCSALTVDKCPIDENLGAGSVNMQAISPHTGKPAGCYGPCLKLIDPKWNNVNAKGRTRNDADVIPYCCTTPPLTSETCNAGPIVTTKYVQAVHEMCPGVYSFAYDDGMGLMRCSYGQYQMTFYCPGAPADAPTAGGHPPVQDPCHGAIEGEECCRAVKWAKEQGINEHPEWYVGLTAQSSSEQFQAKLHETGKGNCPAASGTPAAPAAPPPAAPATLPPAAPAIPPPAAPAAPATPVVPAAPAAPAIPAVAPAAVPAIVQRFQILKVNTVWSTSLGVFTVTGVTAFIGLALLTFAAWRGMRVSSFWDHQDDIVPILRESTEDMEPALE